MAHMKYVRESQVSIKIVCEITRKYNVTSYHWSPHKMWAYGRRAYLTEIQLVDFSFSAYSTALCHLVVYTTAKRRYTVNGHVNIVQAPASEALQQL